MKLRQIASGFTLIMVMASFQLLAQSSDDILGIWYNTEKTAKVKISKINGKFQGKIVWLEEPNPDRSPALDLENDDNELQKRPLMGLTILEQLTFSKGMWKGGTIYDPKSGNTYSCEIRLKGEDTLEVKGYLGFSFIGRTVEWTQTSL